MLDIKPLVICLIFQIFVVDETDIFEAETVSDTETGSNATEHITTNSGIIQNKTNALPINTDGFVKDSSEHHLQDVRCTHEESDDVEDVNKMEEVDEIGPQLQDVDTHFDHYIYLILGSPHLTHFKLGRSMQPITKLLKPYLRVCGQIWYVMRLFIPERHKCHDVERETFKILRERGLLVHPNCTAGKEIIYLGKRCSNVYTTWNILLGTKRNMSILLVIV